MQSSSSSIATRACTYNGSKRDFLKFHRSLEGNSYSHLISRAPVTWRTDPNASASLLAAEALCNRDLFSAIKARLNRTMLGYSNDCDDNETEDGHSAYWRIHAAAYDDNNDIDSRLIQQETEPAARLASGVYEPFYPPPRSQRITGGWGGGERLDQQRSAPP